MLSLDAVSALLFSVNAFPMLIGLIVARQFLRVKCFDKIICLMNVPHGGENLGERRQYFVVCSVENVFSAGNVFEKFLYHIPVVVNIELVAVAPNVE